MASEFKKKLLGVINNEVGKKPSAVIGRVESLDSDSGTISVAIQNPSGNGFVRMQNINLPEERGVFQCSPQNSRVIVHTLHGQYSYSGVANTLPSEPFAPPLRSTNVVPRNGTPGT